MRLDLIALGNLRWAGERPPECLSSQAVTQVDTVQLLLRVGADVNAMDSHGETPLHWAAHFNNEPVCRLLLNQGGDAV